MHEVDCVGELERGKCVVYWLWGCSQAGCSAQTIGTGATGVQVTQELGPDAKELVVFQRSRELRLAHAPETAMPHALQRRLSGDFQANQALPGRDWMEHVDEARYG